MENAKTVSEQFLSEVRQRGTGASAWNERFRTFVLAEQIRPGLPDVQLHNHSPDRFEFIVRDTRIGYENRYLVASGRTETIYLNEGAYDFYYLMEGGLRPIPVFFGHRTGRSIGVDFN